MTTKKRLGWGIGLGAVVVLAFGGAAACSSDFSGDCHETRTCADPDDNVGGDNAGGAPQGDAGGASSDAGAQTGGANANAGEAGAGVVGGAAGNDAAAGAGGVPDCHLANNCPNDPPKVVAIKPKDEEKGVEPDTKILIELSEPPHPATVMTGIQILDGGVPVKGKVSVDGATITFTPDKPLGLLASYEVEVSTKLADLEGAGLAEAFESSFAVRDGSWKLTTVVPGVVKALPWDLKLNGDGQALVSWIGAPTETTCAATARWYDRGKGLGTAAKPFTVKHDHFCADVHSNVSPNGLALISWYEESDGQGQIVATAEFRNGQWGAATQRSMRFDNYNGGAAVSDDGTMHYFGTGSDVQVWQTDTQGAWSTNGKVLSAFAAKEPVQTAVAANGDMLAAWLDADATNRARILVASYSKQTATWSAGAVLPGSLSVADEANRGAPAVAFDAENQPLVVWKRGAEIVASHTDSATGTWKTYVKVGSLGANASLESPALAFDGDSFVVGYTSTTGQVHTVNLVRFDNDANAWGNPTAMQTAATKPASRMPRLTADAHGNLLLLWASVVETGVYSLSYERFDATQGVWLGAEPIDGVTINDATFDPFHSRFVLGGSANGLAAASFGDLTDAPRNLRLASFY